MRREPTEHHIPASEETRGAEGTVERPRVEILTFGCRVNQYEENDMRRRVEGHFESVDRRPDVLLINGCTVTALAEKKARQAARRIRRTSPGAKVVLMGCLADAVALGLSSFDEADLCAGRAWRFHVARVLQSALEGACGVLEPPLVSPDLESERSVGTAGRVRAHLKVQDGCDLACAYCRPTQVRGPSRSKSLVAAVAEAKEMSNQGISELVLTGINLAAYGTPEADLARLIEEILDSTPLRRLRLGSINPAGLTPELLEVFAADRRCCPHFHVPLQSGDDRILAAMHRGYTRSAYLDRIDAVARRVPGATFGADVMVGFPGEDAEAFEATLDLVERVPFLNLHVFRFSPRPGTEAASLPRPVSERAKRIRARRLRESGLRVRRHLLDRRVGTTQHVLAEAHRQGRWLGYTHDYIYVSFESNEDVRLGDVRPVRIEAVSPEGLRGAEAHRDDTG